MRIISIMLNLQDMNFWNRKELGFQIFKQGIDPVVARITLSYKTPLRGGDVFACRLYIKKECLKYVFYQDIYRLPDNKLCLKAVVECVCLINGKMKEFKIFDDIFEKYNRQQ